MEKNPSGKSDELTPRTEERKMSSNMCLLKSEMEKSSSCTVGDLLSKVVAGSSDDCDDVVKEEYEICDANGFSSTVLCGEELDNMMPLECVKVELTEENSETYIHKAAGKQEEFSYKDAKSCTFENKSDSVTTGETLENKSNSVTTCEKASNNANQASLESVEGSTGSEVKVQVNSSTEKQKVNKDSSGNR
jgi:hypothetical protein